MAKQSSRSAVLAASARMAGGTQRVDFVGEAVKTYTAAAEKYEAERKQVQNEVNNYLLNLKTDIDFTALSETMQPAVVDFLKAGRDEYAEAANIVAKSKNTNSDEYKQAVETMNRVQREYDMLAKELLNYNQNKVNLASGGFDGLSASEGADQLNLYKNLYELQDEKTNVRVEGGHLIFNIENKGDVRFDKLQQPDIKSAGIREVLGNRIKLQQPREYELTNTEITTYTRDIKDAFTLDSNFRSFIFDGAEDINLGDIKNEYIELENQSGGRDKIPKDKLEELKARAADKVIETYKTDANIGIERKKEKNIASRSTARQNKPFTQQTQERRLKSFQNQAIQIAGPRAGERWISFTKDGKKIIYEGGVLTTEDPPAYYVLYDESNTPVPNVTNVRVGYDQDWIDANN